MGSKHTPGPYTVDIDGVWAGKRRVYIGGPNFKPGKVGEALDDYHFINNALNSYDLTLAVLEDILDFLRKHGYNTDSVKSAISKAKGK